MTRPKTYDLESVVGAARRISRDCPTRIWSPVRRRRLSVPDPPLGHELKYVIEIPLEWWEELCELLGVQDGD